MKKAKVKTKGRIGDNIVKAIIFTVLAIYALSMIVLLIWGFMTSLKNYRDFSLFRNVVGLPSLEHSKNEILFGNYIYVLKNFDIKKSEYFFVGSKLVSHETVSGIWKMLLNTFIYAGVGSFLSTICSCTVGYLCAKYKFKFSGVIYGTVVFTMVMPLFGQAPSLITLLRKINLFDEFLGQWLMSATFANMYFLVFYAFYEGLSDAYLEAAEIDGASQFRVMTTIAIPLAKNTIMTIVLIVFVALWNDYNAPILYLPTKPTLAYGVFWLQQRSPVVKSQVTLQVASLMMLVAPILVLFIIFKNRFMGNLSMGGIKE